MSRIILLIINHSVSSILILYHYFCFKTIFIPELIYEQKFIFRFKGVKMNGKTIGAIFCVCIFTFGSIPVLGFNPIDNLDKDPEINKKIENLFEEANITFGDIFCLTNGPASKIYSQVDLLEGSEYQMNKINRVLNRKILRPLIFLRQIPIFFENLSFTVEFKRDVKDRSRFTYFTTNTTVKWNETTGKFEDFDLKNFSHVLNKVHKVKIENMTGLFIFQRFVLFDRNQPIFWKFFHPAKFIFIGFCDNITYFESYINL